MRLPTNITAALAAITIAALVGFSACGGDDPGAGAGGNAGNAGGGTSNTGGTTPTTPVPLPPPMEATRLDSGNDFIHKSCHGMETDATFFPEQRLVSAVTNIWSHCEIGGFTGGAWVLLKSARDRTIAAIEPENGETWGVIGRAEAQLPFVTGEFERTVNWVGHLAPEVPREALARVSEIVVVQGHKPRNRVLDIINQGIAQGKTVAEIITAIGVLAA